MNQNYNVVPNIITGKDLDYLSDMFSWNYGALKSTISAMESINDINIKDIHQKAINLFDKNLKEVLEILKGGINE